MIEKKALRTNNEYFGFYGTAHYLLCKKRKLATDFLWVEFFCFIRSLTKKKDEKIRNLLDSAWGRRIVDRATMDKKVKDEKTFLEHCQNNIGKEDVSLAFIHFG